MRRRTALLLVLSVFVLVLGGVTSSQAACTMAGSCKAPDANLTCGTGGTQVGLFRVYVTPGSNASEIEACNDTGAPNSQGRLVLRVNHNTTTPGARLSLDSDRDQTPSNICCSYINGQVGVQGTGIWCGEDGTPNGVPGDGYSQPWTTPGHDGTDGNETGDAPGPLECVPTQ